MSADLSVNDAQFVGLDMSAKGKWHVETSHGTYYLVDMDNREYTRTAGVGRNSLGRHDVGRFDRIRCAVGESMFLDSLDGLWVATTPVTLIARVGP